MSLPSDRKYAETHEWFKVDGDVITVGISQFAAEELTDITYVDLPAVGTKIEAGREIGEIESVKATSELISAVSGEVVAVNEALADAPELVNDKPFDEGWMVKISCSDQSPLESLMDADAYEKHIAAV
jgi:glycine cleavage system H protein